MTSPFDPVLVRFRTPGRYARFSLPLPKEIGYRWTALSLPIRVFDGERELPCQIERQTRYTSDDTASVFVLADGGAGAQLASVRVEFVLDWYSEREHPPFQFHPAISQLRNVLQFERDASGRMLPPTMNGPVCIQRQLAGRSIAWATFYTGCPEVYITQIAHNAYLGASDARVTPPLFGAPGWEAVHVLPEPLTDDSGYFVADGWLRQRQGLVYRYVLRQVGTSAIDSWPTTGVATDAWESTPALAPHFVCCADLSWATGLESQQSASWAVLHNALQMGTQYPPPPYNYPDSRRNGICHYGFAKEGGEAAGTGVDFASGPLQAFFSTGNTTAILRACGEQRVRMSRDSWLIVDDQKRMATWEQYAPNDVPLQGWRLAVDDPGQFDSAAGKKLDGPFGYSTAIPAVADQDLIDLKAFETTDWAHVIRSASWDYFLAQSINCPASRWLIRARGELARMAWRSGNRQNNDKAWAAQGLGINRDRILGWQIWSMNMAYAWGNNDLRRRFYEDMRTSQGLFKSATRLSQTICAITSGKQVTRAPYNGQYAVCVQPTGECQLAAGFASLPDDDEWRRYVLTKATESLEWLRRGGNECWSAAVWKISDHAVIQTRDDTLSSHTWASGQYDDALALGILGLAGMAGVPGALDQLTKLLGPDPLSKLKARGLHNLIDTDLFALRYLQDIQ